ncbi:hypothetical protein BJ684DRAFT_16273 [Piptocephalis cylindrospora]|uniref:Rhomboid-type serine protease n=1 Tax=Piptocephalis cylindrospora TaxID=1907219 RepID=A0A4P9Y3U2_9FUNG|nr:hypothetical protein BJ684DRAFT_16273 [Piptocephalis cylindrospora]|eukprot:RKP13322.1 hypothetical protein BJ684DRAFT_16273 [Piptocephalis cylindrospora]
MQTDPAQRISPPPYAPGTSPSVLESGQAPRPAHVPPPPPLSITALSGMTQPPFPQFTIQFSLAFVWIFLVQLYYDDQIHLLFQLKNRPMEVMTAIRMGARMVPCMRPMVLPTDFPALEDGRHRILSLAEACGASWAFPYQGWRFGTSALLHYSWGHLGTNLLAFILFTWGLERRYGWRRVAGVFWVSAVGSALISSFVSSLHHVGLGASAAIFGLMGAYVVDVWLRWGDLDSPRRRLLLLFIGLGLLLVMSGGKHVDSVSHLSGMVLGAWSAGFIFPRKRVWCKEAAWRKTRFWLMGSLTGLLLLVLLPLFYLLPLPIFTISLWSWGS